MTTDPIITMDGTPWPSVMFSATTQFRWARRTVKLDPFFFPDETVTTVLQQMYQGSDGTQRWEDVPIVDETKP
jgi:hypothetical protein